MVALVIFAVACFFIYLLGRVAYLDVPCREKWPPIDEDEFMRRCRPGTNRDVALRVRAIVAEQLGVDYERVYPEQNFGDDLGCD